MAEPRSHQRRDYPMLGMREFRDTFHLLTEPVRVIRTRKPNIEIVGTWTPNPKRSDLQGGSGQ